MADIGDLTDISYSDDPVEDGVVTNASFWNDDILNDIKTQVNNSNTVMTDEIGTDTTAGTIRYRITTNEAAIATNVLYLNQAVKTTSSPTFQSVIVNAVTANGKSAATVDYVNAAIVGGAAKATQAEVSTGTNNVKYLTPYAAAVKLETSLKAIATEVATGTNNTKYVTPLATAVLALLAGADFTGNVTISAGNELQADTISQKTALTGTTIEDVLILAGALSGVTTINASGNTLIEGNVSIGYQETSETIAGASLGIKLYVGVEGATDLGDIWFDRHTNTAALAPHLVLARSRGLTHATAAVVQDNDYLGRIVATGHDGTDYGIAAQIHFEVDDPTPAATDMGGAIVFSNSVAGTESLVETMRIANDGTVTVVNTLNADSLGIIDGGNASGT